MRAALHEVICISKYSKTRIHYWLLKPLCLGALVCGHQKTFGTELKIKVKPGDNVTLFGDCVIPLGLHIYWIKNNSYGNQSISLFAEDLFQGKFPRFHFVANSSSNSFDLHIKNVSVNDEGIYYCAKAERIITDVNKKANVKLEYQYGNKRTHLSLLGKTIFVDFNWYLNAFESAWEMELSMFILLAIIKLINKESYLTNNRFYEYPYVSFI